MRSEAHGPLFKCIPLLDAYMERERESERGGFGEKERNSLLKRDHQQAKLTTCNPRLCPSRFPGGRPGRFALWMPTAKCNPLWGYVAAMYKWVFSSLWPSWHLLFPSTRDNFAKIFGKFNDGENIRSQIATSRKRALINVLRLPDWTICLFRHLEKVNFPKIIRFDRK